MATSPTQLSLAWLKKEGYLAEVVEKWIPGANIRKDLWGWCDIVALSETRKLLRCNVPVGTTSPAVYGRLQKVKPSVQSARLIGRFGL
jgi:hypothetical protein